MRLHTRIRFIAQAGYRKEKTTSVSKNKCAQANHSLDFSWITPIKLADSLAKLLLRTQCGERSHTSKYILGGCHVLWIHKKPGLSAMLLVLGAFNPCGAILALPLILWYNRRSVLKFVTSCIGAFRNFEFAFFLLAGRRLCVLKS